MQWKNEIPNKYEFMRVNTFNFIELEKGFSELVHEKNFENVPKSQMEEVKEERVAASAETSEKKEEDRRTTTVETITLTESKTDYTGAAPKRYVTKCFIQPTTVPCWYQESLTMNLNSTKKHYDEKIYFKQKLVPYKWSESMSTEVKTGPKWICTESVIPVEELDEKVHYMSLEPQQKKSVQTEL